MQAQKALEPRTIPFWKHILQYIGYLLEGKQANHKQNTIAALDGVRAIACLSVVTFHITLLSTTALHTWTGLQFPPLFSAVAYAGDTGINLFFVLSGFLLFLPYASAILYGKIWPSWRRFYLRRVFRILPAYYASLLLMICLYSPKFLSWERWPDWLAFLTLFLDSSPTTYKQVSGPLWTLAVEWQFYLILPLLALGIAFVVERLAQRAPEAGTRLKLIIGCLLLLAVWGVFSRWLGLFLVSNPQPMSSPWYWPIGFFLFFGYGTTIPGLHGKFLENFALGMLVSTLYIYTQRKNKRTETDSTNGLGKRLRRLSPYLFIASLLWLLLLFAWKYAQSRGFASALPLISYWYFPHAYYDIFAELGYGIGYSLLLLAVLFSGVRLKRIFEWKPLRWIGLLSYGLYMLHLNFFALCTAFLQQHPEWPALLRYSTYWGWFAIFIIPCAFLLFVAIERPFIQLGTRLTKATKKQAPPRQEEPPATTSFTTTVKNAHTSELSEPGPAHIHQSR